MPAQPTIGVHLPHGVPDVDGATILDWARTAEDAGFSSIGVAERLAYASADAVVCLAAAAAVTRRIRLLANILIASLRAPAVFAKELATISLFAPGRLSVGVAAGARPQDYEATGVAWTGRGRRVSAALGELAALREPTDFPNSVGPVPAGEIEILVGGASKGALERLVRYGHGYVGGGVKPEFVRYDVAAVRGAWAEAGREGEPRIVAGAWYSSEGRIGDARAWRDTYLERGGPPEQVRAPIACGAEEVNALVEAYAAVGATEVVLFGCVPEVSELEWLAEVMRDRLVP